MKCKLLVSTADLSRDEWLEHRRNGIGGSEAASIIGQSKWASPYTVWGDKTGIAPSTFEGNEATEFGNLLELPVAQRYAQVTNKAVVAVPAILYSISHPFMLANVDYFIVPASDEFPAGKVTVADDWFYPIAIAQAILEIKTTGIVGRASREWENDSVPVTYEYQGLHYSAVTGIRDVVFCALVGGQGLVIRERTYSDEQTAWLERMETDFWKMVEGKVPPAPIGIEADFALLKSQYPQSTEGVSVEADDFVADLVAQYRTLNAELTTLEAQVKEVRASLEQYIGSAEELTYGGETLVTYKSNKSRSSLNTKALAEAHPAIVAEFTETKPGARVFRVKEAK